jgi:hypothetical protein
MTEDATRGFEDDGVDFDDPAVESDSVWRFGPDTAAMMASRVDFLYRALPRGGTSAASTASDVDGELRRLRVDLERAADVSLDLFDRVLALLRRIDAPAAPADDAGTSAPDEVVVTVAAGSTGRAELWLHNISDANQSPPELRCGVVADFDGVQLPPDRVRVNCADAPIAGRNSRRVELVADVPADTRPGTYHGLVVSRDTPLLAMRVRVVVE